MLVVLCLVALLFRVGAYEIASKCHDPALGGYRSSHRMSDKKFLMIHGEGGGIGNFLVFFPAAYYFAALSGREIVILDRSLIGEFCMIIRCGFPLFSEISAAYPSVLNEDMLNSAVIAKTANFHEHLQDPEHNQFPVVWADGFMEQSGWYTGHPLAGECVSLISGCGVEDFSCHDRHALQQLVRGPFRNFFTIEQEKKIVGIPANFRHGMVVLPHERAPRFDAAVHLRCQFQHFEWLVGPDDAAWPNYVKEVDDWLYSTDVNKGKALFQEVASKIMAELSAIVAQRRTARRRRRLLVKAYNDALASTQPKKQRQKPQRPSLRGLVDAQAQNATENNATTFLERTDAEHEAETYHGADDATDRIMVYLASDNERVKETFAEYLMEHHNVSVARVHTGDIIVHAKNREYLKNTQDGVLALAVDWYSLSLANALFTWRRDTGMTSTFARSAEKMSGNPESLNVKLNASDTSPAAGGATRMFQLTYRNGMPNWGVQ